MSFWTDLRVPAPRDALITIYDCQWLAQHAQKAASPEEIIAVMSGFFATTGALIADAGGRLLKTAGDNGVAAFPAEAADAGVLALRAVKEIGEAWLAERGYPSRVLVKCDIGPVVFGMVGAPGFEILEVYGKPVAASYMLPSTGFAMTAEVFRSLAPETRSLFRKHTPPIRYIDLDDPRPKH